MVLKKQYQYLIIGLSLLLIDLLTKILAHLYLQGKTIPLLSWVLTLTYVQNTGSGFGLFKNQFLFLTIFSIVAIVILLLWFFYAETKQEKAYITFLIVGATGNFVNRVMLGYVIDFIKIYGWPVFNVADILITISIILLCIQIIRNNRK